jgi:hypothetical protein
MKEEERREEEGVDQRQNGQEEAGLDAEGSALYVDEVIGDDVTRAEERRKRSKCSVADDQRVRRG